VGRRGVWDSEGQAAVKNVMVAPEERPENHGAHPRGERRHTYRSNAKNEHQGKPLRETDTNQRVPAEMKQGGS